MFFLFPFLLPWCLIYVRSLFHFGFLGGGVFFLPFFFSGWWDSWACIWSSFGRSWWHYGFFLFGFSFGIGSGACGVVGLRSTVHSFGPEHYYYSLFSFASFFFCYHLSTLLLLLRLLRLSLLLHYTVCIIIVSLCHGL